MTEQDILQEPDLWLTLYSAISALLEEKVSVLFVIILLAFIMFREGINAWLKWRKPK